MTLKPDPDSYVTRAAIIAGDLVPKERVEELQARIDRLRAGLDRLAHPNWGVPATGGDAQLMAQFAAEVLEADDA